MVKPPQKWTPGEATKRINACGRSDELSLHFQVHARERLVERDLTTGDVLHVLRYGFVFDEPVLSDFGHFKYAIEAKTPNSDGRVVRLILVAGEAEIKLISVMWRDEQ
jgi:hypothetical protein